MIEKEIKECYDATKTQRDDPYYRGLNDAYLHLLRVLGNEL